jgi:hypothetical protein
MTINIVYETISSQSSLVPPKKSRPSTSQQDQNSLEGSRTGSPVPSAGRPSESQISSTSRPSFEKNRALRMFRSGSLSDSGHNDPVPLPPSVPHKRSVSQASTNRKHSMSAEDDARSNVSTPDLLMISAQLLTLLG